MARKKVCRKGGLTKADLKVIEEFQNHMNRVVIPEMAEAMWQNRLRVAKILRGERLT